MTTKQKVVIIHGGRCSAKSTLLRAQLKAVIDKIKNGEEEIELVDPFMVEEGLSLLPHNLERATIAFECLSQTIRTTNFFPLMEGNNVPSHKHAGHVAFQHNPKRPRR